MGINVFFKLLLAFCLLIISLNAFPQGLGKKGNDARFCGYKSCPKFMPNMLNVHLVPHTHDDVGWLKTVDQYYYGSETLIQKAGVQYILDSVIQELLKDPAKRFIYVESAFFFKWWNEQKRDLQEMVKELVNEGRLVFIGGAWSMNDEATTHYQSTIDQFSLGLKRLNDTFGKCARPRIGWQIDPFGHSREMASIFANMGYDGLFFARLDYQDKRTRQNAKSLEMIWKGSANLGQSSNLFTGILYNHYQPPPGFCFDVLCADEPIIDGKDSPDNNVEKRVSSFIKFIKEQRKNYRTNNIILTMGGDFTYMDANIPFKNLDKLIRYTNEKQKNGSDINLFYSTPMCYLKSLHDANITWPTKEDDFFPYGSDPHSYWTGYFTSRPTLKRYERIGNHFLQICKQLTSFSNQKGEQFRILKSRLNTLREAMGVMQHHDAITGTEKQKVAFDYARQLDAGIERCEENVKATLNERITGNDIYKIDHHDNYTNKDFAFKNCLLLNISVCDVTESSEKFIITVYNALSHSTFEYVRVPVSCKQEYIVTDYRGVTMPAQSVPIPSSIEKLNYRNSTSSCELIFFATELPAMGYKSYFISTNKKNVTLQKKHTQIAKKIENTLNTTYTIGNKNINLTFDSNGLLSHIFTNGVTHKVSQHFLYYEGAVGDNKEFQNRSSGAYIFRPNNTITSVSKNATIKLFRGPLVEEIHQEFNDWVSQVVRVYKDENYVEFEWLVGPIPIEDKIGKEIVSRFDSNIKSDGIFYTDSNGREMIKRKRNHRDTWKVALEEQVSGNYYPVTSKIALEDDKTRLAILVDRAQGGSSLEDGSLELMVHRRLLHDDAFGVDEALNEEAFGRGLVARGKHYLIFGSSKTNSPNLMAQERFLQLRTLLPSWQFFSDASRYSYSDWKNLKNIDSLLRFSLPQNIHLMTLEPWNKNEILLRFEHILEKDEDEEYSKPVTFYLHDVLEHIGGRAIINIEERTLDGNLKLEDMERLNFKISFETTDSKENVDNKDATKTVEVMQNLSKPKRYVEDQQSLLEESNEIPKGVKLVKAIVLQLNNFDKDDKNKFNITLNPMEIKTFALTLEEAL